MCIRDSPNRAVLTTSWGEHQAADIKKDTAVRYQGGVKSDILTDVKACLLYTSFLPLFAGGAGAGLLLLQGGCGGGIFRAI